MTLRQLAAGAAALAAAALLGTACSAAPGPATAASASTITTVGAENQYANVISQVGGKYVTVTAIVSNPNTDPHAFEASARVAQLVSQAGLVVQNGLGYDSYMDKIEAAAPSARRQVIDVQKLLGLPDSTPNPHLWYKPSAMRAVATAIAAGLARLQPAHAAYFRSRAAAFSRSLRPWEDALAAFRTAHPGTPVAVTEPVGDYMLQAAGARILTPFGLQADIMNGVDLSPQYVSLQDALLTQHKVAVFLYNQQVTDSLTQTFLATARRAGVPVVGLYETMPAGYTYQSWMLAEVRALQRAVAAHTSTQKLGS